MEGNAELDLSTYETEYQTRGSYKSTIQGKLSGLRAAEKPLTFYYVVSIDTSILRKALNQTIKILKDRGTTTPEYTLKVESIDLSNKNELSFFIEGNAAGQRAGEDAMILATIDSITISTVNSIVPSSISLPDSAQISTLREMSKYYQNLNTSTIQSLLTQDYAAAYQSIELLGFSFSRSFFPYFLIFFQSCISICLLFWVRQLRNNKVELFTIDHSEDIIEPLVNHNVIRFIILVILPPVSVFFSLPPYGSFDALKITTITILCCLLVTINTYCYFKSKSL